MIEPGGASQPPTTQLPVQPALPARPGEGVRAAGTAPAPQPSAPQSPAPPAAAGPPEAVLDCFDAVPAMLWALDGPHLRVAAANAGARASVDARPDLLGTPFRDVLPQPQGRAVLAMLEAAFAAGEPAAAEFQRLVADPDGQSAEGVCRWSVLPTFHPDGSVRGLAVAVVDATEQARSLAAAHEAGAVAERRYREVAGPAQDAALALRRTLLPSGVPVLSRLRMAAQYRVAEHAPAAGGDWFDALPLGDGRVVLVVGDVTGHGAAAAGAMGQLRAVALEAVVAGEEPATVLARLDRFAATTGATSGATLCLVVLDPVSGELIAGSHGHPVPLVVAADGGSRFLPVEPAWPLGTGGPAPHLLHDHVAPGDLLLLYTDGLVERPGRRLEDTMAAFARVASTTVRDAAVRDAAAGDAAPATTAALADHTAAVVLDRLAHLESVPPSAGYRDDATLLVAHLRPPLAPLVLRHPAGPDALAPVQHRLQAWLREAGVPAADAGAVLHAVGEAVTNAVEHAYPGADPDAWVELRAQLTRTSQVRVTVRDGGTWRPPAPEVAGRGWGMLLMRELVDEVDVRSDAGGTTVTLTHRVERPAVTGAVDVEPPAVPNSACDDLTVDSVDGRVRVAGPVDAATAERLRVALRTAIRGGDAGLVVDLTGVTQLASVGVHMLHELAAQGAELQLVAPPDAPAHTVLRLAGLADRLTTVTG